MQLSERVAVVKRLGCRKIGRVKDHEAGDVGAAAIVVEKWAGLDQLDRTGLEIGAVFFTLFLAQREFVGGVKTEADEQHQSVLSGACRSTVPRGG